MTVVLKIEKTQKINVLTLNEVTYTVVIYNVLLSNGLSSVLLDTKSMATNANAFLAIFNDNKALIKPRFDALIAALPEFSGGNVTVTDNIVHYSFNNIMFDSSCPSPQPLISGQINQSYIKNKSDSDSFNFLVPDYFVQAQNDNKLNYEDFWSYMPNFELAFHQVKSRRCKKTCCNCKKHHKPTTTHSDLHLLLNNIYSVARLVLLEQLTPDEGIIQINALWKSFKKYEVKDSDNTKVISTEGETESGLVAMRVRYRLKTTDVILATTISGVLENTENRKKNLYFNVSTVSLTSEPDSDASHAFNKSIAQFDDSTSLTGTSNLSLSPIPWGEGEKMFHPGPVSPKSFGLGMVYPNSSNLFSSVKFAVKGTTNDGTPSQGSGINGSVIVGSENKVMIIDVKEIGDVTIEIVVLSDKPSEIFTFRNESNVTTIVPLDNLPAEIFFAYIYDKVQDPLPAVDFLITIDDKP